MSEPERGPRTGRVRSVYLYNIILRHARQMNRVTWDKHPLVNVFGEASIVAYPPRAQKFFGHFCNHIIMYLKLDDDMQSGSKTQTFNNYYSRETISAGDNFYRNKITVFSRSHFNPVSALEQGKHYTPSFIIRIWQNFINIKFSTKAWQFLRYYIQNYTGFDFFSKIHTIRCFILPNTYRPTIL